MKQNLALEDDPPEVTGNAVDDADVITASVESGDPRTAATLADAYVQAYIDVKREQTVDSITAASAELETKITELQGQIETLDAKIAASSTDDDATTQAQRRSLDEQLSSFREHIDQLQVDAALSAGSAELIRPASTPVDPIEPTPVRTATLAAVVGLLLGLGAALLMHHLDDSVRTEQDLARLGREVPLLAVVPTVNTRDGRPVSIAAPESPPVEAYRNLRTNVQFLGTQRKLRSIQVTSTRPGEGKTTTAANLAVVLSQTGANVVLVDGDLRKPDLHRVFAIDGSNGLTNNLHGDPMELTMQHIADQLWVIVGGPVPPNPSELLSGRRMDAFCEELARRFDFVIIDSPPLVGRQRWRRAVASCRRRAAGRAGEASVAAAARGEPGDTRPGRGTAAGDRVDPRQGRHEVAGEYEYATSAANTAAKAIAPTWRPPPICSSCAMGSRSGMRSDVGKGTQILRCRSSVAVRPSSPRPPSVQSTASFPAIC